ncbi:hypothetical protein QBC44DRAFT_405329 [Cladorrhinum sp. PSN332]|nr:hypothetical protein QBC44DRAFT_405329 [Cladorrhinum sp. PSN332]
MERGPNCRYRRVSRTYARPACQLIEVFEDAGSEMFIGESFDGRTWIDLSAPKQCANECPCHQLGSELFSSFDHGGFTLVIAKTPASMTIEVRSLSLASEIIQTIGSRTPLSTSVSSHKETVIDLNGLHLLKYFQPLAERLWTLQMNPGTDKNLTAEMELLVNGILSNSEVFHSYGHAKLVNEGLLLFEQWKDFKIQEVNGQIDILEEDSGIEIIDGYVDQQLCTPVDPSKEGESGIQEHTGVHAAEPAKRSQDHQTQWEFTTGEDQRLACAICTKSGPARFAPLPRWAKGIVKGWEKKYPLHQKQEVLVCASRDGDTESIEDILGIPSRKLQHPVPPPGFYSSYTINSITGNTTALIEAARKGHAQISRILIAHGADVNLATSNTTPLVEAVRVGCIKSVKLLIGHGADVNTIVAGHTALSIAACKAESEPIARLLLVNGADVHMATAIIRQEMQLNPATPFRKAYAWLNTVSKRHDRYLEMIGAAHESRQRAVRLRLSFQFFHQGVKDIQDDKNGRSWKDHFEKNMHAAWFSALRTLRSICNGVAPGSLHELLSFLILARAMLSRSASGWKESSAQHLTVREFREDLPHWASLLDGAATTGAYFDALADIWGLDRWDMFYFRRFGGPVDSKIPKTFQQLAMCLVSCWGGERNLFTPRLGLLWTQKAWRERQDRQPGFNHGYIPEPSRCEPYAFDREDRLLYHSNRGANYDPSCTASLDAEPGGLVQTEQSLGDEILRNSPPDGSAPAKLVMLMAGAIFTMVVAFLLALRNDFMPPKPGSLGLTSCSPENVQKCYLQTAAADLIGVVQYNSPSLQSAPEPLLQVLIPLSNAIESREVECFSQLGDFIQKTQVKTESDIKSDLLLQLERMKRVSTVQRSYTFLHAYLGLGLSGSVVKSMTQLLDNFDNTGDPPAAEQGVQSSQVQSEPCRSKRCCSSTSLAPGSPKRIRLDDRNTLRSSSTPPSPGPSAITVTPPPLDTPLSQVSSSGSREKKTFCDVCQRDFGNTSNYGKHQREIHDKVRHKCRFQGCTKHFARKDTRDKHEGKHAALTPQLPAKNPQAV